MYTLSKARIFRTFSANDWNQPMYLFPSLEECRAAFEKFYKQKSRRLFFQGEQPEKVGIVWTAIAMNSLKTIG